VSQLPSIDLEKCSHSRSQLPSPDGWSWKDSDSKLTIEWIEDALLQQVVEVLSQKEHQEQVCEETYEYVEEDEIDSIIGAVFDENYTDDE